MKTIYGNETGQEFIGKLNDNFAECLTGGGNGNVSVNIPLQGGELKTSTGYADGRWCQPVTLTIGQSVPTFTYTDDNYNKYLHTPCYISLKGNKVNGVTIPSGSTLSIFCYDDSFSLLSGGIVSAVANIPDGAAYVKMQIYNSSGFASVIPLGVTFASQPKFAKNSFTPLVPQYHNFECKPPKLFDDAACTTLHEEPTGATADVDNTRYHDNGFVMLPPNYSPDGEPTKFIIWFSGDACMFFMAHTPFRYYSSNKITASIYEQNFKYLCNMGYAVVSFTGYTSMWSGEPGATAPGLWSARIKPSYIAALHGFYDFLMKNYNFDPRPYIAAKSAGGYMLIHTAATMPFPIRAAAGISIGMMLCTAVRRNMLATQKTWHKMLGCANWNSFKLNSDNSITYGIDENGTADQQNDYALVVANRYIYRKYDPFLANCKIEDFDAFYNALKTYGADSDPYMELPANATLKQIWNKMHKIQPVPTKLWCASKDKNVSYGWHLQYVDWVSKNGGVAELRSYTGDNGNSYNYHAMFCGEGGETANNLPTPYGGTMNGVNIGIVEAVEWFKRW